MRYSPMTMDKTAPSRLLACDLDGTLFPAAPDPSHPEALARFEALRAANPGLVVAYVTGRHLASAVEAMAFWNLPRPDALSCDVGTSVHLSDPGAPGLWRRDEAYAERMRASMAGVTTETIRMRLADLPGLALQDPERQGEFKVSYELPRGAEGDDAETAARARLDELGVAFSVIRSSGVYEDGDLLDVLPAGATKTTAVTHIAEAAGVRVPRILYAGDSRNDLAPLLAAGGGIVPANAQPALLDALLDAPATVYRAAGVHLHGVVEGALHFGLNHLKGDG